MQPELPELCARVEEVFLTMLLPPFVFGTGDANAQGDSDEPASSAGLADALFPQAFAAALERAGGLGLGREIYRSISGSQR